MTQAEAYRAGWRACMIFVRFEKPDLGDPDLDEAWCAGFFDACEAPLSTRADPATAGYEEN